MESPPPDLTASMDGGMATSPSVGGISLVRSGKLAARKINKANGRLIIDHIGHRPPKEETANRRKKASRQETKWRLFTTQSLRDEWTDTARTTAAGESWPMQPPLSRPINIEIKGAGSIQFSRAAPSADGLGGRQSAPFSPLENRFASKPLPFGVYLQDKTRQRD